MIVAERKAVLRSVIKAEIIRQLSENGDWWNDYGHMGADWPNLGVDGELNLDDLVESLEPFLLP